MVDTKAIPLQAWKERLQEFQAPRNCSQSAHEGGKIVSPTHRPPVTPLDILLALISVRGWVDSRAIVRLEGFSK
jgi:hypothetical protein